VKGSIITMLNINKAMIPCAWMLGVVHSRDMHNHPIDYLCLSIGLGWKVIDLANLVSIIDHGMDHKVLKNLLS
jgi:hypothetical protein